MNWSSRNTTLITVAGLGSRDDVPEPQERGRASQHETDLIGDTRSGHRLGHRSAPASVVASGFSQKIASPRCRRGDRRAEDARRSRCRCRPRRSRRAPRPPCRTPGGPTPRRTRRVDPRRCRRAGSHHVGTAATERLRVVGGDEAGRADEADAQRTGFSSGHGGRRRYRSGVRCRVGTMAAAGLVLLTACGGGDDAPAGVATSARSAPSPTTATTAAPASTAAPTTTRSSRRGDDPHRSARAAGSGLRPRDRAERRPLRTANTNAGSAAAVGRRFHARRLSG